MIPFIAAFLAAFIIGGPTHNPLVGAGVGIVVFIIASALLKGGKKN